MFRRLAGPLEDLYARYNRRASIRPDPLEFVYRYGPVCDREIAGLVASSLALGRVRSICASVEAALAPMGAEPCRWLRDASPPTIRETFRGFRHRFISGEDLAALLVGARRALRCHGSLGRCFAAGLGRRDETVREALAAFVAEIGSGPGRRPGRLLPDPARGSACKRLNLLLRWFVRQDDVDPGGWRGIPPAKLIVPLDTHMHHLGRALGLTARVAADFKAALEVTRALRTIAPDDPVRYDFALTRLMIRAGAERDAFLARCGVRDGLPGGR